MIKRTCQADIEHNKQPKHARVPFHIVHCQDCGRELRTTHVVMRFGGRCRPCYSSFHAVDIASSMVIG